MPRVSKSIIIKPLVIGFWLSIFSLFLFVPRFMGLFKQERSLTIFTFPLLIDAQQLHLFELETGIKLYIHYYENNDELLAKMRSTKGHGFDLIFPSDYAADILIKDGLLKKINKSRLTFWPNMYSQLLGHYFDPANEYTIPYQWEVYGIGYDEDYFKGKKPPATWKLVFDEKVGPERVGMINNAREVVALAALYLFGTLDNIDAQRLEKIKQLLLRQKKRVEVYTDLRANYLLASQICPIAVCTAGDIWRHGEPGLGFLLPKEGSFVVIDSVCIPAASTKVDWVYQLLDYLYRPDVMEHHTLLYSLWPSITGVAVDEQGAPLMKRVLKQFNKFHFFKNVVSEKKLSKVWIYLKAD